MFFNFAYFLTYTKSVSLKSSYSLHSASSRTIFKILIFFRTYLISSITLSNTVLNIIPIPSKTIIVDPIVTTQTPQKIACPNTKLQWRYCGGRLLSIITGKWGKTKAKKNTPIPYNFEEKSASLKTGAKLETMKDCVKVVFLRKLAKKLCINQTKRCVF